MIWKELHNTSGEFIHFYKVMLANSPLKLKNNKIRNDKIPRTFRLIADNTFVTELHKAKPRLARSEQYNVHPEH